MIVVTCAVGNHMIVLTCAVGNHMIVLTCAVGNHMIVSNVICCVADINECLPNGGKGPCAQICNNTIGSFQCSCNAGYTLSGYACNGENTQRRRRVSILGGAVVVKN